MPTHSTTGPARAPAPSRSAAPSPTAAERLARDDLRRQIADARAPARRALRLRLPAPRDRVGDRRGRRAAGALRIGELERVRDALALRLRDAQAELARRADVEEANRGLLERMIAEPERHRWVLRLERGHRRARLPALALAPALGHPRDAVRLVAGPALLRLSVSRGAAAPGHARSRHCRDGEETPQAPAARLRAAPARRAQAGRKRGPPRSRPAGRSRMSARRRPGARSRWSSWSSLFGLVMLVVGFFLVDGARGTELLGDRPRDRLARRARAVDPRALRRLSLAHAAARRRRRGLAAMLGALLPRRPLADRQPRRRASRSARSASGRLARVVPERRSGRMVKLR